MAPERWRQISSIYNAAQDRPPAERAAFLQEVCGGDALLQQEIESLFAYESAASKFLEDPPVGVDGTAAEAHEGGARIPAGARFGDYEVVGWLASGGMGEVYVARDLKLERTVALKFLALDLTRDPGRLARFRQEARAASSLNHPNICTIYTLGETPHGQHFIAMEHIAGETLRAWLGGQHRPLQKTLDIAIQIASALTAAHAAGIVHRDLKPENVMLRPDGLVKVVDFGIAKLMPAAASSRDATHSGLRTDTGIVAGTTAYMSPEQARGERLDHRTDLFSLGSVLYEMATGRRAFHGFTNAIIFNDILNSDPLPPRRFNPGLPAELEDVLHKLHVKDRTRRYQTADELLGDLSALQRRLQSAETAVTVIRPRRTRGFAGLSAAVVLIGALVYMAWIAGGRGNGGSPQNLTFTQITTQEGPELFPNLFPDGRSLIYASPASGNWDIYFQRVGGQNVVNLTGDSPADDTEPALSPDGELIAFRSEREGGGIYVMGSTGESSRRLTDVGYNPAWSPDSRKIAFADESVVDSPQKRFSYSRIWTLDLRTGVRTQISKGDAVQPQWSPHGYRIAYWMRSGDQRDVWTMRADGGDPVPVTTDASLDWSPAWSADGKYLYFSSDRAGSTNLWRVRIDEGSGRTVGPLEPFTTGGGLTLRMHARSADATHTAYVEQMMTENLYRVSFDPAAGAIVGEPAAVTRGMRLLTEPDLSPNGEWVAFCTGGPQEDIVIARVNGSSEIQLTRDGYKDRVPRWSPDGQRIAFYSDRTGGSQVWVINRDGSGLRQVTQGPRTGAIRSVWSPDGRRLASSFLAGSSFIVDLDQNSAVRATQELPGLDSADEWFDVWSWSPDGKWLAGRRVLKGSGNNRGIVLYSLESGTYTSVLDFGESARWLQDNKRLLFLDQGRLSLVDRSSRRVVTLLTLSMPINSFALSPDNHSVYFTGVAQQADVWLITFPSGSNPAR